MIELLELGFIFLVGYYFHHERDDEDDEEGGEGGEGEKEVYFEF